MTRMQTHTYERWLASVDHYDHFLNCLLSCVSDYCEYKVQLLLLSTSVSLLHQRSTYVW